MSSIAAEPLEVLRRYPTDCQPAHGPSSVRPLGNAGGFSGARLWQVDAPRGLLCLRCWPAESPSLSRLAYIHAVLAHLASCGVTTVPVPIATTTGSTFVAHPGQTASDSPSLSGVVEPRESSPTRLWELTPWLPGKADFAPDRDPAKLDAALQSLAELHLILETFPANDRTPRPSPGIARRLLQLEELMTGGYATLAAALQRVPPPSENFCELGTRWLSAAERLSPRIRAELRTAARHLVPLQPCLRDIWHDHVLFEGPRVSGFIDFGAMLPESVSGDVARLLGSFAQTEAALYRRGLEAYRKVRPLSHAELQLLWTFDHSASLLSPANWFRWIVLEGRTFEPSSYPVIERRIADFLARLECL